MTLSASYAFDAIGTSWSIDTVRALTGSEKQRIAEAIDQFDRTYSRFRDDSLVSQARREAPCTIDFPSSVVPLYDIYVQLHELSTGRINPLVGESLERLGYDKQYSLQETSSHPAPSLHQTLRRSGTKLTFGQPALLDVGAVGKGQLIDIIAAIVARSHDEYVIDGSGDIAVRTSEPEIIGFEHPTDPTRVIGTISLKQGSLCASATNRRAWGDGLHHIIDATTGRPTTSDIIATWAIAESTILADALTTGLFFVSPDELARVFGPFQYVIMKRSMGVRHNLTPDVGEVFG